MDPRLIAFERLLNIMDDLRAKCPWDQKQTFESLRHLTIEETFYFASMIHLMFVKIHPWNDGNGRSARLIEKWFLAQKLGEKAWYIQSEKNYYQNHQT